MSVAEVAPGLFTIDAMMFGEPQNLSPYVILDPVPTLIEPGPATCHEAVARGLAELGVDDLAQIVVTHIHMDHAGGTGHLVERFPGAHVWVHEIGARHLADPSRLVASATRIYGEDGLRRMWGVMRPIDPAVVHAVAEGDHVPIGDSRSLEVLYTPGHAKHHMSLLDSETGIAFVGDCAGLTFPGIEIVHPIVPPPDIDVALLEANFRRYRARGAQGLGLAHFSVRSDVDRHLDEVERRLHLWAGVVGRHADGEPDEVGRLLEQADVADMRAGGHPEADITRMRERTEYATEASGLLRWIQTRTA